MQRLTNCGRKLPSGCGAGRFWGGNRLLYQSPHAGKLLRLCFALRYFPAVPAKPSALIDTGVIYCGNNFDQLRMLPEKCVDLIYFDPPFMRTETMRSSGARPKRSAASRLRA